MSDCTSVACKDGNCEGCKDGVKWCSDTRCSPYCSGCEIPEHHDYAASVVIISTVISLFCIMLIILFFYGPSIVEGPYNY